MIEYFDLVIQASELVMAVYQMISERFKKSDEEIERYLKELENLKGRLESIVNPSSSFEMRKLLITMLKVLRSEMDQIRFRESEEPSKVFNVQIELVNGEIVIPEKAHWPKYEIHFDAHIGYETFVRAVFQSTSNFFWEDKNQLNDIVDCLELKGKSVKALLTPSQPLLEKHEIEEIFSWFNLSILVDWGVEYDT